MNYVFEVEDRTKRKIHLSEERWKHIRIEHPEIINTDDIELALTKSNKIIPSDRDNKIQFYFIYNKQRKRYLKVPVKYLNGNGYVITAHYTTRIQ